MRMKPSMPTRWYIDLKYYQREVYWRQVKYISKEEYSNIVSRLEEDREYRIATSNYGESVILKRTLGGYVLMDTE